MTLTGIVREGFGASASVDAPPSDAFFVRPSAHSTYMMCPMAVQLVDQPGYDGMSSMQAARGTGLHALIELHLNDEPTTSLYDTVEIWVETMAERGEDIRSLTTQARIAEIAADIYQGYQLWIEQFYETVGKRLTIVSTERQMQMPLGTLPNGREVWLRGTSDLVTPAKVWDWKSSTSGWAQSRLDELTQHISYAALVQHELAMPVHEAAYVVYDFAKQVWSWDQFTVEVTPEQVQRQLVEMFKMGAVLEAGLAAATPAKRGASWGKDGRGWWCSAKWCGAWDICDGKHLLNDGLSGGARDNTITWK